MATAREVLDMLQLDDLKSFRSVVFVERGSAQPWSFGDGMIAKTEGTKRFGRVDAA
jgi:hypothetical protein